MLRFIPPNWTLLSGESADAQASARWLREQILLPVMAGRAGVSENAPIFAPLPTEPSAASATLKALELAPLVFADASYDRAAVYYLLGVRDIIAAGLSLIFEDAAASDTFSKSFGARRIVYDSRPTPQRGRCP